MSEPVRPFGPQTTEVLLWGKLSRTWGWGSAVTAVSEVQVAHESVAAAEPFPSRVLAGSLESAAGEG